MSKTPGTDYTSGMYSTKMVNSRMVEGNKYITLGDPYKDPLANAFRQPKKGEVIKPFITKGHPVNAENGHFVKITYVPTNYKEGNMYISTQPLDKRLKGFGSKDAFRRDEFASEIRCSQYREGIKKELELSRKNINPETAALAMPDENTQTFTRTQGMSKTGSVHEYDIGRTQVTEFDPRSTKDQYYKMAIDRDKGWGSMRPVSKDIGDMANDIEYKPPKHGGGKSKFYDSSHLKVSGVSNI
jgi:hypothetical protein